MLSGTISIHSLHSTTVLIAGADGVEFSYWHVVPTVRSGQRAVAYRTVIGHIEEPVRSRPFFESSNRRYLNRSDPARWDRIRRHAPRVTRFVPSSTDEDWIAIAHDGFDLVAAVEDETPLPFPALA